ncbi:MAG: polysaccharide biosynthesis C-terminal domain-containing protein [Acidobacteriota bacterium]
MFQKLKQLSVNLTVYGVGDVAIQLASVLLLPVYTLVLSPSEYGVIGVLLALELVVRVVSRWGVDAAFMRFYTECADSRSRQLLASTLALFLAGVSGALLGAGIAASPWLSPALLGRTGYVIPTQLVFLNALLGCFSFLPFHVLRLEGQARAFVALTFSVNLSTLLTKFLLVVVVRWGVLGVFLADTIVAIGLILALLPRFAVLLRPVFSRDLLGECLRFGLPRLPHGIAHQITSSTDRYFLSLFRPSWEVGVYQIGATLAMGMKLFLSAFETAWAPFYFKEMHERDARQTFRIVTTYGVAALALLCSGLAAVAFDLVRLMTATQYVGASRVVPWLGLAVAIQGLYLLTSIGLNITKRTAYYPLATGAAAVTSVVLNLLLIPRFGILGAAWASVAAYCVLAAVAFGFSQRFYRIDYEWGRILRVIAAACLAWLAGRSVLPPTTAPVVGLLVRGMSVVAVFLGALAFMRFFHERELRQIRRLWPVARLTKS